MSRFYLPDIPNEAAVAEIDIVRALLLLLVIWAVVCGLWYSWVVMTFPVMGAGDIGRIVNTLLWQAVTVIVTGILLIASVSALVTSSRGATHE